MITFLVDSDYLIDYLRGDPTAVRVILPLIQGSSVAASLISYAEIFDGLLETEAARRYSQGFADLVAGVSFLGIDLVTAEAFARLRSDLRQRGQLVPDHDIWIAATALTRSLTLLSRDNHFDRIPGLLR